MKTRNFLLSIAVIFSLSGCSNNNQSVGADHDHETCDSHDHQEGHSHDDGHEHADDDDHDHDGHEHGEAGADGHADEIVLSKAKAEAAGLKTETVAPGQFSSAFKTSGQIQAPQGDEQTIVATMGGVVSFVNGSITEGTAVKVGETIVNISAKGLQDGDPNVKAKAAYDAAEKEYQRAQRLVEDKIISQKEFEQIRLNYETAKATYQGQAANVTKSGVRVASPISGYVKQLLVSQGEYVAVGQPIAIISQSKRLQLKADVPERRFKELRNVNDANFKTSYDNTVYKLADLNGKLVSKGKTASGTSGFIPVTFEFDNKGEVIPGSFAEVYLIGQPRENVISLPISALTEEQGLYFVYVQIEPEAYTKRQVTIGQSNGERVEITSGLQPGDNVVTHGTYNVKLASTSGEIPHGHSH